MRGCSHSVQQLHAVADACVPPPPLPKNDERGPLSTTALDLGVLYTPTAQAHSQ
jgi:hypothetical protein